MQTIKNSLFVLFGNLDYFGIYILLFIAVAALALALITLVLKKPNEIQARLSRLVGIGDEVTEAAKPKLLEREQGGMAAKISRPMHRMASFADRSIRNRLRLKLMQAGYRTDTALFNYLAAKILLPLLMVGIYLVSRFFYRLTPDLILGVIILAAIGYFLPNLWVWLMIRDRRERLFRGLPDALDLMVICVESGLGLDMTFKRVGEEIREICKDLSNEFNLANLEIRAGKARDEAFRDMALRCNVPEVNNLMTVLSQTSRFGTSLATALRVHADAMRIKRRQLAEEIAAKSTVKMVFPLVLFIFPSIFVVLIGPGAIRIMKTLFPAIGG
jgi:tight adherence protein C